jgi:hypothetical protein
MYDSSGEGEIMTQLITGLYSDHANAHAAAEALKQQGFAEKDVRTVTKAPAPKGKGKGGEAAEDALTASLVREGVPKVDAARLSDAVKAGSAFVSVRAGFGEGDPALRTVKSHGPTEVVENRIPDGSENGAVEEFPLSASANLPLLLDTPLPVSSYIGSEPLKEGFTLSSKFGWPLLSDNATPLSSKFGWKLLSDKVAIASSWLGLKELSDDPTPLSSKLGLKLLSDEKTPLSSKLGAQLLSDDPAPVSSQFNLPVLTDKTFLT